MHEIGKNDLSSVSLLVGTGKCNANCLYCAGVPLRSYAPKRDGVINESLFRETLKNCYERGANYLSISSSGEPTLSPRAVTKTLELSHKLEREGIKSSPVNLYSNGIIIVQNKNFSNKYLPLWKDLGLTTLYITIHGITPEENAKGYGVEKYPSLEKIFSRINQSGLNIRVNTMLSKVGINSLDKVLSTVYYLKERGIQSISAWPIRDLDDKLDYLNSPKEEELFKIKEWFDNNSFPGLKLRLLNAGNSADINRNTNKMTLFPDGTLSDSWCKNG